MLTCESEDNLSMNNISDGLNKLIIVKKSRIGWSNWQDLFKNFSYVSVFEPKQKFLNKSCGFDQSILDFLTRISLLELPFLLRVNVTKIVGNDLHFL